MANPGDEVRDLILRQLSAQSTGSGFDGPRPNGGWPAPDRHASATRSAVLGGTGDENLVGDET